MTNTKKKNTASKEASNGIVSQLTQFAFSWTIVEMSLSWILGNIASEFIMSIVTGLIFPFFGLTNISELSFTFNGETFYYGKPFSTAISFVLSVIILFIIIEAVKYARAKNHLDEADALKEEPDENLEVLKNISKQLTEINKKLDKVE